MSANTGIQWTDATWNPVVGCSRVGAGCDNCYAVGMSDRLDAMGQAKYAGLTVEQKPAVVARLLGRSFIGVELNPEYARMAEDRIRTGEDVRTKDAMDDATASLFEVAT